MKVLITGAFGNVGLSVLNELMSRNHQITVLEVKNRRNLKLYKKCRSFVNIIWGDIRNKEDVREAVKGNEAVIHLAAIIPPLADVRPQFAKAINVEGTRNLVRIMEEQPVPPRLLFSSSVAVYGDRLKNPMIELEDEIKPNSFDEYAKHKVEAETIIRRSAIDWSIFRLTFIVPPASLKIDRLMFEMPLATSIEVCDTRDVGLAFSNALGRDDISGQTFHIAGGAKCRTSYGEYINRMMELFGIGRDKLPVEAFAKRGYHCGFMNTDTSREKLVYQVHTLEDHYAGVKENMSLYRFLARIFRPILVSWIENSSPYYREWKKTHKRLSIGLTGANAT